MSGLWLAIRLPRLALDLCQRGGAPPETPLAVVEGRGGRPWVWACNGGAREAGVAPGMGLAAAYAMLPALRAVARAPRREQAALENLAAWAGQYTSQVSLEMGEGLVLEVGGSLGLFGGLERLWERLRQGLEGLGYTPCLAAAPTPSGAWLLARAGQEARIEGLEALRARLAALPLAALDLSEADRGALAGLGLRRLGELLELPREGLARRLGEGLIRSLDRALGRVPDPRRFYVAAPRFEGELRLAGEVADTQALLFPLHRLLLELCGRLSAASQGVREVRIGLVHGGRPATWIELGLLAPSRDPEHLLGLARERLERTPLAAPVEEVRLHAERLLPLVPLNYELFEDAGGPSESWERLVERLAARLGGECVRGLGGRPDHRPERAWEGLRPGARGAPQAVAGARPLWLLDPPRPLEVVSGHPYLGGGMLALRRGPERIESGWWDGADVARDYFLAEGPSGERLWVFRRRRGDGGWFLHGLFA